MTVVEDYPHEKMPEGIIKLSKQKFSRVKNLYFKYREVGFSNFSLIDMALLSTKQWKNRDYPIPKGYMPSHNKILVKKTVRDLIHS
jgi:hypothetical protein